MRKKGIHEGESACCCFRQGESGKDLCCDVTVQLATQTPRNDCFTDDDSDTFSWFKCVKGQEHEPENLMPTQIIPGRGILRI